VRPISSVISSKVKKQSKSNQKHSKSIQKAFKKHSKSNQKAIKKQSKSNQKAIKKQSKSKLNQRKLIIGQGTTYSHKNYHCAPYFFIFLCAHFFFRVTYDPYKIRTREDKS
jgi:hypothetical protein